MANIVADSKLKAPKALTLKQLTLQNSDSANYSLSDLAPLSDSAPAVISTPSNYNNAAYAAMLTGGSQMIDNFHAALAEGQQYGNSQTVSSSISQAASNASSVYQDSLKTVLANGSLSDEQKMNAVSTVANPNSDIYSPSNLLSMKMLDAGSSTDSSPQAQKTRYDSGSFLVDLNKFNNERQSLYNSVKAQTTPSTLNRVATTIANTIGFGIPQRIAEARIESKLGVGNFPLNLVKSFIHNSGNKDVVSNMINGLPVDKAMEVASNIADVLTDHGNPTIFTPSQVQRNDFLNLALGGQTYTDKQQLSDNISGWMDTAMLGAPLVGRALAGVKTARSAGEIADQAIQATKAEAVDASSVVDTMATSVNPNPSAYVKTTKNSLGQFLKSRENLIYDSSNGVPYTKNPENTLSSAIRDALRSDVQPVSVFENAKNTNPDMARAMYDDIAQDASGEVSKAVAGTSRAEALADPVLPEVDHADGSVANKINAPDLVHRIREQVPSELTEFFSRDGKTQYSQQEKAAARSLKVNNFRDATGMTPRQEMFQLMPNMEKYVENPQGFDWSGVYGPQNGGFINAEDAVNTAKIALRNSGIDESNLGILRKDPESGQYIPTTLDEINNLKAAGEPSIEPATSSSKSFTVAAKSSKGMEFDLTDQPTTMDTSGYGLKDNQWIREVVATDKDTGDEIGRLIYTNYDKPPSVRVNPEYQRQGVATGMLKLAKARGGNLGEDATGKFASGEVSSRTAEGQAFRSGNDPDSVSFIGSNSNKLVDDYLISVRHKYVMDSADVDLANLKSITENTDLPDARVWSKLSVKRNWTDRFMLGSGRSGKLSNYVFSHGDQLSKLIYRPALASADHSAGFEKSFLNTLIKPFSSTWKSLSREEQAQALDEIHAANAQSRDHNFSNLVNQGFSSEQINALKQFRRIQDVNWYLRNQYLTKELRRAGFEEFVHSPTNTILPAKRILKGGTKGTVKVYDYATDSVKTLSSDEIKTAYDNGGGLARLRQPLIQPNGDTAEYVVHTNSPTNGYLRSFTNNSQVLNYRPGHFDVRYKEPYFIVKQVGGGSAKGGYEQAVATAETVEEANAVANNLTNSTGEDHFWRPSKQMLSAEGGTHELDMSQAQGMSSFRHRGKLLEDSNYPVTNMSAAHIQNPIESVITNLIPLSKKVVMQDVTNAIKQRALAYYSHLLPKNDFGQPLIPKDLRDIRYRGVGNYNPKEIADARTTFGYANMLEQGYVNMLDVATKGVLNQVADTLGRAGLSKAEKAARWLSNKSLTRGAKSLVYRAFIGWSPQVQLIVQGQQAALTAALNPKWVASIKAFSQPAYLAMRTMGIDANHSMVKALAKTAWGADSEKVFAQFKRAGLTAAIDHNSFISGAVNDMAKNMINNSKQGVVNTALAAPRFLDQSLRKIGFDAGEFYSQTMTWLAHRDLAERKGLNPFADDVADDITGAARNYTGAMNFAGDLPTSKNALGLIFQFTQNSQKMLLNAVTNRSIDPAVRNNLKLLGVALYGLPTSILYNYMGSVKDPDARQLLSQGLEGWTLNKMLSLASDEKSTIDWSGLSPFNAYGALDALHTMWTQPIGTTLANMPSSSLLFGNNPRVKTAVTNLAKYFNLVDDYSDPESFLQVANDFAKITSGWSDILKAKYVLEVHKKVSSSGYVSDENLDKINAIGALLGRPTIDEAMGYYINNLNKQTRDSRENDVLNFYKQAKLHYENQYLTGDQLAYTQKVLNEFHRAFGDDQFAQEQLNKLITRDLNSGHAEMFNNALRNCPLYSQGDCMKLIDAMPFGNEQDRESLKALIKAGDMYKPEDNH